MKVKCKHCKKSLRIEVNKHNYICAGENKIPKYYKNDLINLCVSGMLTKANFEFTPKETCYLISVLGMVLTHFKYAD